MKGIPLLGPKNGQMVNGHLANNYFLTMLEANMLVDNAMDFNHIFNEALSSKLQKAKTQCYKLA
jgi:hypothetical protein